MSTVASADPAGFYPCGLGTHRSDAGAVVQRLPQARGSRGGGVGADDPSVARTGPLGRGLGAWRDDQIIRQAQRRQPAEP
jgi:hypothetical protein